MTRICCPKVLWKRKAYEPIRISKHKLLLTAFEIKEKCSCLLFIRGWFTYNNFIDIIRLRMFATFKSPILCLCQLWLCVLPIFSVHVEGGRSRTSALSFFQCFLTLCSMFLKLHYPPFVSWRKSLARKFVSSSLHRRLSEFFSFSFSCTIYN